MKKILLLFILFSISLSTKAQGWPTNYHGVMLQGFYWDSFNDTKWTNLASEADELSDYFSLIWVPQSGNCLGTSMGYNDLYWYDQNSSFGSEDELRSMISTFNAKGVDVMEDVVINHRAGVSTWTDFPTETYKGVTYQMGLSDICNTDECVAAGYKATGAADTGDDFNGYRDLDHTSDNVQTNIKAYLKFLLNDLSYNGFRYDMVKGYAPKYTSLYNQDANPKYSVGEYFDGSYDKVSAWIDATKDNNGHIQSAAFDFPLKFCINSACNNGEWDKLMWKRNGTLNQPAGLIHMNSYQRYAITFVDNHDTYRDDNKVSNNIEAANAFILSMPGTPCVFLPHWKNYKSTIKQLITARKLADITNQSIVEVLSSSSTLFVAKVEGDNGTLYIKVGNGSYTMPSSSVNIITGNNFQIALDKDLHTLWCNKMSGSYDKGSSIFFTAISNNDNAKIYYTTDGTTPSTTNGEVWTSSNSLNIDKDFTLKAVLSDNEGYSDIITRIYTVKEEFVPHTATIYVKTDWDRMYFYAWQDDSPLLGEWPGTEITETKTMDGKEWYYHTFDINEESSYINILFDQGSNINQTVDITNLTNDAYFVISEDKTNGKYTVTNKTDEVTGINSFTVIPLKIRDNKGRITIKGEIGTPISIYTLTGQKLMFFNLSNTSLSLRIPAGIYIINNIKVLVR